VPVSIFAGGAGCQVAQFFASAQAYPDITGDLLLKLTTTCRLERSFAVRNYDASFGEQQSELTFLLQEINSVAIRLRQRGRPVAGIPGEVPGAEHAVLEIIRRSGALTVPQIARERSTSRQNIQILVDRLAATGQVELANNPAHKRSVLVQLTSGGKALLDAGSSNQKQLMAHLGSVLSPSEVGATIDVLKRIQGLLSSALEMPLEARDADVGENSRRRPLSVREEAQPTIPPPLEDEFPVNLL
jgi:DNA-binding MarR family transcriptional regulator